MPRSLSWTGARARESRRGRDGSRARDLRVSSRNLSGPSWCASALLLPPGYPCCWNLPSPLLGTDLDLSPYLQQRGSNQPPSSAVQPALNWGVDIPSRAVVLHDLAGHVLSPQYKIVVVLVKSRFILDSRYCAWDQKATLISLRFLLSCFVSSCGDSSFFIPSTLIL